MSNKERQTQTSSGSVPRHTQKSLVNKNLAAESKGASNSEAKHAAVIKNPRLYFDAIARKLSKKDRSQRIRYIRSDELPITLKDIIDLSYVCKREVGIYLDKYKLDPSKKETDSYTKRLHYTPICLYAGEKYYKKSPINIVASFPPGGPNRYRRIAHIHNTTLTANIATETQQATDDVEIVVNKSNLIVYYKKGLCLNEPAGGKTLKERDQEKTGQPLEMQAYTDSLKRGVSSKYQLDLNTEITLEVIYNLNNLIPLSEHESNEHTPTPSVGHISRSTSQLLVESTTKIEEESLVDAFSSFTLQPKPLAITSTLLPEKNTQTPVATTSSPSQATRTVGFFAKGNSQPATSQASSSVSSNNFSSSNYLPDIETDPQEVKDSAAKGTSVNSSSQAMNAKDLMKVEGVPAMLNEMRNQAALKGEPLIKKIKEHLDKSNPSMRQKLAIKILRELQGLRDEPIAQSEYGNRIIYRMVFDAIKPEVDASEIDKIETFLSFTIRPKNATILREILPELFDDSVPSFTL